MGTKILFRLIENRKLVSYNGRKCADVSYNAVNHV